MGLLHIDAARRQGIEADAESGNAQEFKIVLPGALLLVEKSGGFKKVRVHPFTYRLSTGLRSVPMPSISVSMMSPAFKNSGGLRAKPTPLGVPVAMMSPASSVMPCERMEMMLRTSNSILAVVSSCLVTPLTRKYSFSFCGSGISSAVTIQGPIGQ